MDIYRRTLGGWWDKRDIYASDTEYPISCDAPDKTLPAEEISTPPITLDITAPVPFKNMSLSKQPTPISLSKSLPDGPPLPGEKKELRTPWASERAKHKSRVGRSRRDSIEVTRPVEATLEAPRPTLRGVLPEKIVSGTSADVSSSEANMIRPIKKAFIDHDAFREQPSGSISLGLTRRHEGTPPAFTESPRKSQHILRHSASSPAVPPSDISSSVQLLSPRERQPSILLSKQQTAAEVVKPPVTQPSFGFPPLETLHRVQHYPSMLPVPKGADGEPTPALPYPPPIPNVPLQGEQLEPLYNDPIVDLRRETFLGVNFWQNQEKCDPSSCRVPDVESKKGIKFGSEARYLEGPKELTTKKEGRQIQRYRVLDQNGNEILVYVNSARLPKRLSNPFGTEIDPSLHGKLTPYIPGSRQPNLGHTAVLNTVEGIQRALATEFNLKQGKVTQKKQRPLHLRFDSDNKPHRRAKHNPKRDTRQDKALHPSGFSNVCFPACACCDYTDDGSKLGNCCLLCENVLKCVTLKELFCCGDKMQERHDSGGIGVTPGKVIGTGKVTKYLKKN